HPVEPDANRIGAVRIGIRQRPELATVVPFLARDRACVAAHAGVEVNDQAQLLFLWRRQRSHDARLANFLGSARCRSRGTRAEPRQGCRISKTLVSRFRGNDEGVATSRIKLVIKTATSSESDTSKARRTARSVECPPS